MNIHGDGPAAQWILGSSSLPGIMPPLFVNGEVIVDGCVLNNLPADLVREDTSGPVIAVNLKEVFDLRIGEVHAAGLNGWALLMRKLNHFGERVSLPSLSTIVTMASSLSSTQALERARAQADVFLEPPLDELGLVDWKDWRAMSERGYRYAFPILEEWWQKAMAPTV
jgi:predicted acylesterase/phospholipase RssA